MTNYTCSSCQSTESFANPDAANRAGWRVVIIESPVLPNLDDLTPGVTYDVPVQPAGAGYVCPACQPGGAVHAERLAELLALPRRAGGREYDGPSERMYCVTADVLFPATVAPDDLWREIRELVRGRHKTCADGCQVTQTPEITSMRVDFCVATDREAPALRASLAALPNLVAGVSFAEVLDPAEP